MASAARTVPAEAALVSYEAFCAKYRPLYARYAAARLESAGHGADVADTVLSGFARCWAEALTCASPAAVVWKLFTGTVESSARRPARPVTALPCPQADTVILRHRLGLAPEAAAEVMGISASEFSTLHQAALRALSAPQ
ncbi:hypothetical protein [Streptomyces sp. NPDC090131]|uniref:hypothetical protein n=1 Tax=Streptomyces sp. NPDC090131 TaxID=3365954 RepID=UPI0038093D2F